MQMSGPWELIEGREIGLTDDDECYEGRHYDLFALLAGVRNGRDEWEPIADPRGFPPDAWARDEYDRRLADAHSASFLTVAEMWEVRDRFVAIEEEPWLDALHAVPGECRIVFFFDN